MTIKLHDWATAEITAQFGWTLLHFVWQGTLIAIVCSVLLRAARRRSAEVRYLISCTALALMAACPLATFTWCRYERKPTATASAVAPVSEANQQIGPEPQPVTMPGPTIPVIVEADVAPAELLPIAPAPSVAHADPFWIRAQQQFEPYVPWLVALWLCGVALLSLRLVCGWHWIYRLSQGTFQAVPEPLRERLAALATALAIRRPVRLVESVLVEVPTVIGWLRPLILLPTSALLGLTASQLEAILAHELAHIRRHDFLVNVWQTVMETLLFYHPAVWWISHRMRTERELCCDDLAVSICSNRVAYARALAEMESLRATPRLAVAANGGSLRDRVRRLVSPGTELPRSGGWTASLCAVATAVLVCVFAFAGPPSQGHADDAEDTVPVLSDDVPIDNADVVLKQARPYIVQLKSEKPGGKGGKPIVGLGTGVIFDARGYVLTMRHLVEGVSVRATLADGSTLPAAVVVKSDKSQDLALLKIEGTKPFPIAPWGNSAIVKVGAAVTAIGQEYDRGLVAKQGKITATDRDIEINPEMTYRKLLQMDAEIKPGSSGGPVLNEAGEVVGLCIAIRAGKPMLSFALPIDEVRPIADKLLAIATGSLKKERVSPREIPFAKSDVLIQWDHHGSGGRDLGRSETRIVVREDGTVVAAGDVECRIQLTPSQLDQLQTDLEEQDRCFDLVADGKYFINPGDDYDAWRRNCDWYRIRRGQQTVEVGCIYGWPSDSRDQIPGAVITGKIMTRLGRLIDLARAGGWDEVARALPVANAALNKEFPQAPQLTIDDFAGAIRPQQPSRAILFGRGKEIGVEVERRDDGQTQALFVEYNGDYRDVEKPLIVRGLDLAKVPYTGQQKRHTIADLYHRVDDSTKFRDDVDTYKLEPGVWLYVPHGKNHFYIDRSDALRSKVYGPIAGDPFILLDPPPEKNPPSESDAPASPLREQPANNPAASSRPTHGIFRGSIRLAGPLPPEPRPLAKRGQVINGGMVLPVDVPDEHLLIDRPPGVDLGQGGGTRGIANVAVYLKKAPKLPAERDPKDLPVLKLSLKNFAFTPRVTLWQVGQPLEFSNHDPLVVNIKFTPPRNAAFNQLVGAGKTIMLTAPEKAETLPGQIDSNIINWLTGYLLILDHHFAAITNARGEFQIPELPPGDYEFVIWHERSGYLQKAFKVSIAAGQSTVADLQFEFRESGPWQLVQTQRTETEILAIPAAVQQQVQTLAAKYRAVRGGLSSRRPAALRGLAADDPRVKAIAAQAVSNLDSGEPLISEVVGILRYLGELADDLVIAGTRSENPRIAARCCDLLMYRGPKAIAPLIAALESRDDGVRSSAAISLGQTFQPAAVGPLLKALASEKHLHTIIMALKYLRDPRAIEPLQKLANDPNYGQIATDAIRHIQFGAGYAWWPPESLPDRLLCRDADTWRGESYGPKEIQRMIHLLSSANSNIASEAALFLGRLHADEAVPALAKGHYGYTEIALAEIASPEAIDALFRRLHTPEPFLREATVSALTSADRWAAPLLIALLDDRTLLIPGHLGFDPFGGRGHGKWPDEHRAHAALWQLFANCGLRGQVVNLANGDSPDILAEIPRMKTWWKTHGNDFLQGKDVPNPNLTMVHSSR